MDFPKNIKNAIKECLLAVIWPREDIVAFFKKNGCDKKTLNVVVKHKNYTRSKIIYLMFAHLVTKKDGGYEIFKNMNNMLLTWKKFDSYYFEKIEKLDREDAEKALQNLKDVQYFLDDVK
jgi:hypothetical protein